MESKNCTKCWKVYYKRETTSRKNWWLSKFCSHICAFENFQTKWVLVTRWRKLTEEQKEKLPNLFQKWHTKVGTEYIKKWRENGWSSWNKWLAWTYHWKEDRVSVEFKKAIRTCQKYLNWRHNIRERDNYTCQECWRRRKPWDRVILEVDHIIPFSQILIDYKIETQESAYSTDILWDESNWKTLCKECHKKTESHWSNQWKR